MWPRWWIAAACAVLSGIAPPTVAAPAGPELTSADGASQPAPLVWESYVQGRYTHNEDEADLWSLRRWKLTVSGQPLVWLDYNVQGLFKSNNRSTTDGEPFLQNLWVRVTAASWARFTVGQLVPPFGLERFTSDAEIDTIDRAQVTDHLVPNGQLGDSFARDYGLQGDGHAEGQRIYYAGGLFYGRGANNGLRAPCPLFAARVTYDLAPRATWGGHPLRLHLGGSVATRRDSDLDLSRQCPGSVSATLRHFDGRDTRGDLELAADWNQTSLRAECFWARYDFSDPAQPDFSATGFYVQVAQFVLPKLQAVAKVEQFDPNDRRVDNHDICWITAGLNCFLRGKRDKVMVDYVIKRERTQAIPNNVLVIQAQFFL